MKKPAKALATILLISLLCACNLPKSGIAVMATNTPTAQAHLILLGLTQSPDQVPLSSSTLPASTHTPFSTPTLSSPTLTTAPSLTPTLYLTITPSITPIPAPGTIAGSISGYPYGSLPALAIVAYGQNPPKNYSYIITTPGSTFFSMSTDYLLPGPFQVVAYDAAGNSGACPGFVTVISDQTVSCTISDWASSYRSKPSGVPNP